MFCFGSKLGELLPQLLILPAFHISKGRIMGEGVVTSGNEVDRVCLQLNSNSWNETVNHKSFSMNCD